MSGVAAAVLLFVAVAAVVAVVGVRLGILLARRLDAGVQPQEPAEKQIDD